MRKNAIFLTLAMITLVSQTALADVPARMAIQGRVTDSTGSPLSPGPKLFTFAVFDDSTGGTELWPGSGGESQFIESDSAGLWNAEMGAVIPILPFVFGDTTRWLEVSIDDGVNPPVTLPRVQIASGAFSFHAADAQTALSASVAQTTAADAVNSVSIVNGSIQFEDIGQNGASPGQIMKWNGANWGAANDSVNGANDNDWELAGNVLYTSGYWGIGRSGSTLNGDSTNTHVNLGVACTTGWGGLADRHVTIAGGLANTARDNFTSVGGGTGNHARGQWSTIAGGDSNLTSGLAATVAGGMFNKADHSSASIGGGSSNTITAVCATIAGGVGNVISGEYSAVGGGFENSAQGDYAAVGGGTRNRASGAFSVIGGGGGWNAIDSNIALGGSATVGGGAGNIADSAATISGGMYNRARGLYSSVGGGGGPADLDSNTARGDWSTVSGGRGNLAVGKSSTIGGGDGNGAFEEAATIAGGFANAALSPLTTVGGGAYNYATDTGATVGGGWAGESRGVFATVGGGRYNRARGNYAVVAGGGGPNFADSNSASGQFSVISGGLSNIALGSGSVVAGGEWNYAGGAYAAMGGGGYNSATGSGATIGGGWTNIAAAEDATVGGGQDNEAVGIASTIGGGRNNRVEGGRATIAGGQNNIASAFFATVGGGGLNAAHGYAATVAGGGGDSLSDTNSAIGDWSTVPGGRGNAAVGHASFAAGRRAHALHDGAFVWADNNDAAFSSVIPNEFAIGAGGGLRLQANNDSYGAQFDNDGNGDGIRAYTTVSRGFNWAAVYASNTGTSPAFYGSTVGDTVAYLAGDVLVTGFIYKLGGGFHIDHPLDPENKYLNHSFVESPDMKNIYDGTAMLDASGAAWVDLPEWFEALNGDFRYQLTCVGGYAPVYVAQEISGNRFQIAGGSAGLKVSWQVTGIRRDASANEHRLAVEETKPVDERGRFLDPRAFGKAKSTGIGVADKIR